MSEQTDQQTIEEQTTVSYEDLNGKRKPRSNRGKAPGIDVRSDEEKEKTPKRTAKLTAKQVGEMFELGSSTFVMLGAHPDWYIDAKETAGFAAQLADMLNRIPARYAQSVVDLSGYAVVAVGMYQVFKPRIEAEQQRRELKKSVNQNHQTEMAFT